LNVAVITVPHCASGEKTSGLGQLFRERHGADLGGWRRCTRPPWKYLSAQPWPGNVRQLENVVKRMLLIAHGYAITRIWRERLSSRAFIRRRRGTAGRTLAALCEEALINARREPD